MKAGELQELGDFLKLNKLFEEAGLVVGTMRSAMHYNRELTSEEMRKLQEAMMEITDGMFEMWAKMEIDQREELSG